MGKKWLVAILLLPGCTVEPADTRNRIQQQLQVPTTARAAKSAVQPIVQKLIGNWMVDADATLHLRRGQPPEVLEAWRKELANVPFELQVTEDLYISRSRVMTRADRYRVLRVDGALISIALQSLDDASVPEREITLEVRTDQLLIHPDAENSVAMKRQPNALPR